MAELLQQQAAYQQRVMSIACMVFLLYGLLCLFCPKGIWELMLKHLWLKAPAAPSPRALLAVRALGGIFVLLPLLLLIW